MVLVVLPPPTGWLPSPYRMRCPLGQWVERRLQMHCWLVELNPEEPLSQWALPPLLPL